MNNPLRDIRQPREYWDNQYSVLGKYDSLEELSATYRQRIAEEGFDEHHAISGFFDTAVFDNLMSINYRYSRGDDLDDIRSEELTSSVENMLFVQQEEASGVNRKYQPHRLESRLSSASSLHSVYVMLCWCVCMDVDPGTMQKLARSIAPEGEDRLVDMVLQRYDPGRAIAKASALPRVFGLLDQLMEANEAQRIKLLVKYLNNWGKTMSKLKGLRSLGGTDQAMGAKSNKDLDKEDIMRPDLMGYVGWWAWEVALVVRVFGIDDSSFADHVLYPVDMARYRYMEKSVSLWPIDNEGSAVADESTSANEAQLTNEEQEGMLGELIVVLNLAATATEPALLPDVISKREPQGEYLFYVAADKAHGIDVEAPNKVDGNEARLVFTVDVSFEENQRHIALDEMETTREIEARGERYSRFQQNIESHSASEMLEGFDAYDPPIVWLPIDSGEQWASWLYVSRHNESRPASMVLRYQAVQEDRTLTVRAITQGDDYTVEEMMAHWQTLVEAYRDMPMQRFSGAEVM